MSDPANNRGKNKVLRLSRRAFVVSAGAAGALAAASCKTRGSGLAEIGDKTIVRAAIFPGIGVARIGNSQEFFIGPEVTDPPLTKQGEARDKQGALKRQAARFRIYGYNAGGQVVGELTSENSEVTWIAHLVNKKAQWYRFIVAMDIPESANLSVKQRNATIKGADRRKLVIDAGPRSIGGKNRSGKEFTFSGGKFMNTAVDLGELRTDAEGRLLVLSALGKSGSPKNMPVFDPKDGDTFNNADGWYDDTADGPVHATVKIAGKEIPVEGSWVVVGPPNYAPDVIGWRTLYDLLIDTYIEAGMMPLPTRTSFTDDVLPALRRLSNLQWVNKGFSTAYGKKCEYDFDDPAFIANIAALPGNNALAIKNEALRKKIFDSFRPPGSKRESWPWLYGDAFGTFEKSERCDLAVSKVRLLHLKRWLDGNFDNDWDEKKSSAYSSIDQVPLGEQPAMLTKAALHFCLADAFHPGCEVTWPMRHASLYRAPFRIKERDVSKKEPDYGATLSAKTALKKDGPLYEQGPGDITKWMAIPWQGDTIFCRSGYEPQYDPYLPTFWPARVPNHVLAEPDYQVVMDTKLPRAQRLAAFNNRQNWTRSMQGSPPNQILQMVNEFGFIGVLEARPGIDNDPDFPATMLVESLGPQKKTRTMDDALSESAGPFGAPTNGVKDPVIQAGWEDAKQLEEFRRIRIRR